MFISHFILSTGASLMFLLPTVFKNCLSQKMQPRIQRTSNNCNNISRLWSRHMRAIILKMKRTFSKKLQLAREVKSAALKKYFVIIFCFAISLTVLSTNCILRTKKLSFKQQLSFAGTKNCVLLRLRVQSAA